VIDLAINAAATRLDPTYRRDRPLIVRRLRTGLAAVVVCTLLTGALAGARLLAGEETAFGVTGAHGIAVSGDGRLVAASSGAMTVRLWDITDPTHPVRRASFEGGTFLALSADAHILAVVDDRIRLWDVSDPTHPVRAGTLPTYTGHGSALAFTPDSRLLTVAYHQTVLVYDVADPARPHPLTAPPDQPAHDGNHDVEQSRISPDGRLLAVKSTNADQVTVWTIADRTAPRRLTTIVFAHDDPPFADLAFAPDSTTLATATAEGQLTLWNLTDPAAPTRLATMADTPIGQGVAGVTVGAAVAFDPDGRTLTSVIGSITANRWDITDRSRCHHIDQRTRTDAGPGSFLLTPDARAVVSAAQGADTIRVWAVH
jgi:WD40 repeat protein